MDRCGYRRCEWRAGGDVHELHIEALLGRRADKHLGRLKAVDKLVRGAAKRAHILDRGGATHPGASTIASDGVHDAKHERHGRVRDGPIRAREARVREPVGARPHGSRVQVGGVCLRLNHGGRVGEVDGDLGRAALDGDVARQLDGDVRAVGVEGVVTSVGNDHAAVHHHSAALNDRLLERRGALHDARARSVAGEHDVALDAAPVRDEQFVGAIERRIGRVGKHTGAPLGEVIATEAWRSVAFELLTLTRARADKTIERNLQESVGAAKRSAQTIQCGSARVVGHAKVGGKVVTFGRLHVERACPERGRSWSGLDQERVER